MFFILLLFWVLFRLDLLLFICFFLLWNNLLCFVIFLRFVFFCLFLDIWFMGRVVFCWCCCVNVGFLWLFLVFCWIWVGKLCFDSGGRGFWFNFGDFCFEIVVDFLIMFGNWRKFCFLVLFMSVFWIFFFIVWYFFLVVKV